jgi:Protein of unknown function DUF45
MGSLPNRIGSAALYVPEANTNALENADVQVRHARKVGNRCLEYVIVHELAHLLERNHSERFAKLMDSLLPDWKSRRDTLNKAPLADEAWA